MTTFFRFAQVLTYVTVAVLLCSCERDRDGVIDTNLATPLVTTASIDHGALNLDTTSDASLTRLPDGTYRISQSLYAHVEYAPGISSLATVSYRIYRPGNSRYFSTGPLRRTSLTSASSADYTAPFVFELDRAAAGLYRIEIFAQGQSSSTSNYLQVPLLVSRNNSAPLILSGSVPDTVTLPPGGRLLLKFSIAVRDSDGLGDIAGAFFYSLNSSHPSDRIVMADDGNITGISGDEVAGDGTYTITVELVDDINVRRTFEFEFHAVDLQGADSGPFTKFLTVN